MFDASLTSEISYEAFTSVFTVGCARRRRAGLVLQAHRAGSDLGVPAPLLRAGLRHLLMGVWRSYSKQAGKSTAVATLVVGLGPDRRAGRQARPVLIPTSRLQETTTMSQTSGTKRIVTGAHYGLRDWLAQRVPPPC